MAPHHLAGWLALLGGTVALTWLFWSGGTRPLAREVRSRAVLTRPPGGTLLHRPDPSRSESGWRSSWEVDAEMAWAPYRAWFDRSLSGFEATSVGEGTASFARWQGGDSWILTLTGAPAGSRLRVRATLVIYPD